MKRLIWAMFGVICAYSWLDAYQTYILIQVGATEFNPIIAWCIKKRGLIQGLVIPKVFVLSFLAWGLHKYLTKKKLIQPPHLQPDDSCRPAHDPPSEALGTINKLSIL